MGPLENRSGRPGTLWGSLGASWRAIGPAVPWAVLAGSRALLRPSEPNLDLSGAPQGHWCPHWGLHAAGLGPWNAY
eukprot:1769884-Pyramimonas_sp.AAC.1